MIICNTTMYSTPNQNAMSNDGSNKPLFLNGDLFMFLSFNYSEREVLWENKRTTYLSVFGETKGLAS